MIVQGGVALRKTGVDYYRHDKCISSSSEFEHSVEFQILCTRVLFSIYLVTFYTVKASVLCRFSTEYTENLCKHLFIAPISSRPISKTINSWSCTLFIYLQCFQTFYTQNISSLLEIFPAIHKKTSDIRKGLYI